MQNIASEELFVKPRVLYCGLQVLLKTKRFPAK